MDEVVTPGAESHKVVGAMQPAVTPVGDVVVMRRRSHPPLARPALRPVPSVHLGADHFIQPLALLASAAAIAGGRAWAFHPISEVPVP